jgi:hypothetical protein
MDILFYGFVVFLFAAVILGIEGLYLWWVSTHGAAAQRVARRLQLMSGTPGRSSERISILKQRRSASTTWPTACCTASPSRTASTGCWYSPG